MELTPEQEEQVRRARAVGSRRVTLQFTPEQKERWQTAARQELSDREENVAYFRKVTAAAERPGFFGDLRRAMASSGRPMDQLAAEIGVDCATSVRFSRRRRGFACRSFGSPDPRPEPPPDAGDRGLRRGRWGKGIAGKGMSGSGNPHRTAGPRRRFVGTRSCRAECSTSANRVSTHSARPSRQPFVQLACSVRRKVLLPFSSGGHFCAGAGGLRGRPRERSV